MWGGCAHECRCPRKPGALNPPEGVVTDGYELPNMCTENHMCVLVITVCPTVN